MCTNARRGGEIPNEFKITVGKDGWAYGYLKRKPSEIEPSYLRTLVKELYVTMADGGMSYMYLTVGTSAVPESISFSVKVKDKSGNYLPTVKFTADRFREDLDTGFWTANNRCDYEIYQRFELLEPVLGEIIIHFKE